MDEKSLAELKYSDLIPHKPDGWDDTEKFLRNVMEVLLSYLKQQSDRNTKILEFHHPAEMAKLIEMEIPDGGENLETLVKISCGLDLVSMAGEWLTATANTNMFTYEIAPVFILMEKEVMKKMWEAIGWDTEKADGIFAPGGAIANLYAMLAARHHMYPRSKHLGVSDLPTLCTFTSEDSHYSIKSAAAVSGIGTDYCFNIPVDSCGRMIPEALEAKIVQCKKDGLCPFFVSATAGTTVYGAWDPIEKIADICERHKLWFHVDAAWGGGVLLSPEHRYKLSGIERANSVTWNPHKLMGALLQCSAVLLRQDGILFQCNQMSADYLFMQDKPYDCSFDTGDKASDAVRPAQRHLQAMGTDGFRRQINQSFDLTAYMAEQLRKTEGYELVVDPPEFLNVCFWYIPQSIRGFDEKEKMARLEKIAPKIKAKMMEKGTTMVGYQPDKQRPNFFRMILSNQAITTDDIDFLVKEIAEIGESL
ncbi:unc-25 [Pristionchus pacificus]|uniref:Unc-25 n=1 Tax=Pristionchus pacificus TaxID=54126 RepID=A0A2A6BQH9_PRIPA|nr:unc-25 [Pristionchus pacificus]|eukprot:PDM68174.1 unc-25 [Pristionchus pacificus]